MKKFLFLFNTKKLPIYSTFIGIPNQLLSLVFAYIQLITCILLILIYKNKNIYVLQLALPLLSAIFTINLCYFLKKSIFGYICYYAQMTSTIYLIFEWIKKVLIGMDYTVFYFKNKLYYKAIIQLIFEYIFTGIAIVYLLINLFVILSYSNELNFEEIKDREEKRSELYAYESDKQSLNNTIKDN